MTKLAQRVNYDETPQQPSMPRRSTRATFPSQDDIEVDDQENLPTQQDSVQDADQLMEAEQKPMRRSNTTKSKTVKVKTEKKTPFRAPENAPNDDHSDPETVAPFDRDEFLATARPIPPEGAKTIDGVISDLQTVVHALGHQGFDLVLDTAVAVEETSGNTEEGQEVR
jgi:hypothetical protein